MGVDYEGTDFPWGDGQTYEDLPEALAGGASTGLTQAISYNFPGYLNTGSSLNYPHTANISIPTFVTSSGLYKVRIYGTEGSAGALGSQIKLSFSGAATLGLYGSGMTDYGLMIDNLDCYNAGGSSAINTNNALRALINRCYAHGLSAYGIIMRGESQVNQCVVKAVNGVFISAGNGGAFADSSIRGTGGVGISSARNFSDIKGCFIHGSTYGISNLTLRNSIINSVISGGTYAIGAVPALSISYGLTINDVIFYSEANPTDVSSAGDMAATFGGAVESYIRNVIDDPEYSKTGDDAAWFVPLDNETTPLRTGNQAFAINTIYGTNRDKFSQGAWSDATEISQDDIIDTAGGNWVTSTLTEAKVLLGTLFGLSQTGTATADYPIVENVFNGIIYDNGTKIGTFAPYATTTQTGNVTIPTEAEVKGGVLYDSLLSREGTYGIQPASPPVARIVPTNGGFDVYFIAADESDTIYARVRRKSQSLQWDARSESFKRIGSGVVSVTGQINGVQYDIAGESYNGAAYSQFSNIATGAPDADANATSRYQNKIGVRDNNSLGFLQVAQSIGDSAVFTNVGEAAVTIYVIPSTNSSILDVKTGSINLHRTEITVPRQTNFPPDEFFPGALINLNDRDYQIGEVEGDQGSFEFSSIFTLPLNALGDIVGY